MTYSTAETDIAPGDLVLLTTDGLTEARHTRRDFWGIEGVAASLQRARSLPNLEQIAKRIVSDARKFAGGHLSDDVCLLIAKREEEK
jgi:serine phosphatase RsbU (regulator of sigma subunit)